LTKYHVVVFSVIRNFLRKKTVQITIKLNSAGFKITTPGGKVILIDPFIVELENGFKIYHAGDTGVFSDMKFIGEYYKPDLALLPIGGHFTMDPTHAAYAVRNLLKVSRVIPMHYGTFPPLKGTPGEFKQQLAGYDTEVIALEPGDKKNF
jgi:L-ascorbate metabolism protein UlaG (beta-lactamase superfamily)